MAHCSVKNAITLQTFDPTIKSSGAIVYKLTSVNVIKTTIELESIKCQVVLKFHEQKVVPIFSILSHWALAVYNIYIYIHQWLMSLSHKISL